jgi:RNA polymerase sigma-70 factor (ECF subfamily)
MDKDSAGSDQLIIDLYWDRKEEAISRTAARYGQFVYSVCYNILRQREDSEECQNTTYMKAWNTIPPERPNSLKTFLARIARMTSIDRLREKTRKKRNVVFLESLDDYSEFLADDYSVSDEIEARELACILNEFISGLRDDEQILFVKRYYFNTPVKKICQEMGIPRSTLYAVLDAIKNKLRNLLEKEGYIK